MQILPDMSLQYPFLPYQQQYSPAALQARRWPYPRHDAADPYTTGWGRYVGFANELTAATSRAVPWRFWNPVGQTIGVLYTIAHVVYSVRRAKRESREDGEPTLQNDLEAFQKGGEAMIFQLGGNVALPWLLIMGMHKVVEKGLNALVKRGTIHHTSGWFKALPTAMGLLSIPIITKGIDPLIERFLDKHYLPTTDRWIAKDVAKKAREQSRPSGLESDAYTSPFHLGGRVPLMNVAPYSQHSGQPHLTPAS